MALVLAMTMIIGMNMSALAATNAWTFNNLKQGEQVRAYKLFDRKEKANTGADGATSYNVSYTLNDTYAEFFSRSGGACAGLSGDQLSVAAYQYVAALATDDKTVERSQFAADMWKWILDKNITADKTQTVAEGSTSVTLSLDPGYYLMYPTGANVVDGTTAKSPAILKDISGRETDADRTLAIKSTYPTVEKKIVPTTNASGITLQKIINDNWETIIHMELEDETDEEDSFAPYGAADEKSATDLAIGDTVTYQLTSKVPDMTGYTSYTYKFKDTLSKGLDLKEVLSVYVGTSKLKAMKSGTNTYALDYDTTTRTLTITFNDCINTFKSHVGETITVKYSATLNKDAVVGTDPNTNKVKVEYSNNPETGGTGESEETNAKVYTFGFDIYKYTLKDITEDDNDLNRVSLKGAQFKLYKDNEGTKGDAVKLMKDGDGGVYYQDDKTTSPVEYVETTADGKLTIKGLKEGTYYLEETKAPAGYNGLKGEIKVDITNVKYDETDKTKLTSYDVIYTMPGAATGTTVTVSTNNMTEIPVLNKAGVTLPSTGGRGSMAFTVIGVIIIGAMMASSLMSKKRKSAE